MATKALFGRLKRRRLPAADARTVLDTPAYAHEARAKLAQLAATGTLSDTFYRSAGDHLADVLETARACDPLFVAKAAVHARTSGAMKDMPALLTAYLTVADPDLAPRVFGRVVTSGRMLRAFVQIMRSGQVGRRSLGSRPKRLVTRWLERASLDDLMAAATGTDPSLADIVKMAHPRPETAGRRAFYGWLIGRPYDLAALPGEIAAFEAWKRDPGRPPPPVPFQWLTAFPLTAEQWAEMAPRMGWRALRMNLNTLARGGAFRVDGCAEAVAARLADPETLARVRPMPHELRMALAAVDDGVPPRIRAALEAALDTALAHVPAVAGRLVVCPDVSGSMGAPVTGYRPGASSRVRCVDVAALVTAALLRSNRAARVLPFDHGVVPLALDPWAPVATNAAALAAVGGGGTDVSAPLAHLNEARAAVDLVVVVSDNASWVDATDGGPTATLREWERLKRRNPSAKLVCLDIAPYGTTQAPSRDDILNVGGFTDAVFDVIADFASGKARDWVSVVEATEV